MARHKDSLQFALGVAKHWMKRAKTDTERRRWFDRFCVLAKLYPEAMITFEDSNKARNGQTPDEAPVKEPTPEQHAQEMLRQLNGGDDAANV